MNKILLLVALSVTPLLACGLVQSVAAQKTPENMIEAAVLTDGTMCGGPSAAEYVRPEITRGWVVSRQFDKDEITLLGVVLKDAKDRREYINFDTEYLEGFHWILPGLSEQLVKGTYVRFDLQVCGKISVAKKLMLLQP